jgi:D-alanyl-D-alanine dipeptidase
MTWIHQDFVSLEDVCPGIKIEASYSKLTNFTGSIVRGYHASKAYLHKIPALALNEAHGLAKEKGLGLLIFGKDKELLNMAIAFTC